MDEIEATLHETYDKLESWYEENHDNIDGTLVDYYWDLQTVIRYFLSEKRRHFNDEENTSI